MLGELTVTMNTPWTYEHQHYRPLVLETIDFRWTARVPVYFPHKWLVMGMIRPFYYINMPRWQEVYLTHVKINAVQKVRLFVSIADLFELKKYACYRVQFRRYRWHRRLSDAFMRHYTRPLLVQITACCLFDTKRFSEWKFKDFHSWKGTWKCHLQNGGQFVSTSMCQTCSWHSYTHNSCILTLVICSIWHA